MQEQGEVIEVTNRDEVIARLVPDRKSPLTEELLEDEVWADLERLSSEISAHWPAGLSAVDAVRDAKRELFH